MRIVATPILLAALALTACAFGALELAVAVWPRRRAPARDVEPGEFGEAWRTVR